ncbi:plasmid pRiA4b ORF-3 family protein [Burkholderia ubonensis]|uniref:plasmid pRiA4b ORF-3 family protein n=1 Tax=Burkholderia ubonensis TaxID=101571 RepID=UPI000A70B22C
MAKSFQRFTQHVQIQHIEPPIWRRIEVEGTESLRKLHHILQAAFGWEDTHLHDFLIDGMTYAMFEVDDVLDFADPDTAADDRKVRLQKVLKPGSRFLYRYDFGDGWDHAIVVEKMETIESEPWGAAQVIDGARACPPEDVGGPHCVFHANRTLIPLLDAMREGSGSKPDRSKTGFAHSFSPKEHANGCA